MGLNIKNERVCALAREVAQRTGQTQTAAIESALESYLEALLADTDGQSEAQAMAERRRLVEESLARFDALVTDEDRAAIWQDLEDLYDPETGLPA